MTGGRRADVLARADLEQWLRAFAGEVVEGHEALSDLDSATGDADHGANLERGMIALLTALDSWDGEATPGEFLKDVGMLVVSTVGGSSGALYGTVFLRMSRAFAESTEVTDEMLIEAWMNAVDGVVERGGVSRGDKTMLDALGPAADALADGVRRGDGRRAALAEAVAAARRGRDATADMVARRGKSSYARERSRGAIDPGAASMTLLVEAAARELGS